MYKMRAHAGKLATSGAACTVLSRVDIRRYREVRAGSNRNRRRTNIIPLDHETKISRGLACRSTEYVSAGCECHLADCGSRVASTKTMGACCAV